MRRWVLTSTTDSVDAGKISVLAVVETILCIAAAIAGAFYFETIVHIAITAAVAPFLLLRTPESTETGIKWLEWYWSLYIIILQQLGRIKNIVTKKYFALTEQNKVVAELYHFFAASISFILEFMAWILWVFVLPFATLVKICVTSFWVARRPFHSLEQIPRNWKQTALCTDLLRSPELIPGYKKQEPGYKKQEGSQPDVFSAIPFDYTSARDLLSGILHPKFVFDGWRWNHVGIKLVVGPMLYFALIIMFIIPFLVVFHLTTICYRYSLKSCSFFYFPLVYLCRDLSSDEGIDYDLDALRTSPIDKFKLVYSVLVFVFGVGIPVLAYSVIVELRNWLETVYPLVATQGFRDLLGYWVFAYEWKPLYAARTMSALLTISLFFFADQEIRRRKFELGWSDMTVRRVIDTMKVLRTVSVLYTLGIGGVTFWPYLEKIHLPPFVWDWWPV